MVDMMCVDYAAESTQIYVWIVINHELSTIYMYNNVSSPTLEIVVVELDRQ